MFFEMNWQHRIPGRETSNDFMIDLRRKQIHISHEVPCLKVREIHKEEQNPPTIIKTSGKLSHNLERSTMFNGKTHYFYGHFQ